MHFKVKISFILILTCSLIQGVNGQATVAFPGAEGAGKYTTGGRGGLVYTVTNLNDEGPGSLRKGIRKKGPRTIVFAVNGYINLKSELVINNDSITIAGQTAPGDGITLREYGFRINASNVIIRYLRVRPGDSAHTEMDAMTGKKQKNIIVDHCSFSWATDEVCSMYDNENFTLQYCIISESFNRSYHHKGEHGYGGIWGGMKASFHHNLLAHHVSRNPRIQGSRFASTPENEHAEIVNNVIYNWRDKSMYAGENARYIVAGNYYKAGPSTIESARVRLLEPYAPYSAFDFEKNILDGNKEITKHNLEGLQLKNDSVLRYFTIPVAPVSDYKVENAKKAYKKVLESAGASLARDSVDQRILADVINHTGAIINSQDDVNGWPELKIGTTHIDTDEDGMPDSWEDHKGLNKNDDTDAAEHTLNAQYTNIEIYINEIVNE